MTCPKCNSTESRVVDSRPVPNGVRRRRECERCGQRFTTHEHLRTLVGRRDRETAAA
jgi:transcriptional repressor NrdR